MKNFSEFIGENRDGAEARLRELGLLGPVKYALVLKFKGLSGFTAGNEWEARNLIKIQAADLIRNVDRQFGEGELGTVESVRDLRLEHDDFDGWTGIVQVSFTSTEPKSEIEAELWFRAQATPFDSWSLKSLGPAQSQA